MTATKAMAAVGSAFRLALRVYWEDTDAGGVVFYANYLKFFERARTEWLRSLGFEQQRLKEAQGVMFIVSRTAVNYLRPARLDDTLQVTVDLRQGGRASLVIDQRAWRGDTLLAEGEIRLGCVDTATFQPRSIPPDILEAVSARGAKSIE